MDLSDERPHSLAPVWFEEDLLKADDFNQEQYITELSRYVPLDTIASQLDAFLSQLKLELVEVINAKYNDFVGLAGQLGGAEGAIIRMAKPLTDLKARLNVVERGIESELRLLSASLEHRQKVKKARRSLETMQNAVQISSKIEKLMHEVNATLKTKDVAQQSALLERVAREISRLDLLFKENEELALIRVLVKQNASVTEQIRSHLLSCLMSVFALVPPDHPSALRLLRAISALGKTEMGVELIKRALMKPFLDGIFQEEQETKRVKPLIEKLIERLDQLYQGFFPAVLESSAGLQHYDFLGDCILASFHEQLSKSKPFLFSPGKPDLFLENFKSSLELIDQLELRCATVTALEQFRNGDSVKKFMKAWNLHVYFAMRFQEIAGSHLLDVQPSKFACVCMVGMLDSSLESELTTVRKKEDGFFFRSVSIWVQCLQQCFNPQIVTQDLMDQFIKLFFKLMSRLEVWLTSNIDKFQKGNENLQIGFPQKNEELILLDRDLTKARRQIEAEFFTAGLNESCQEAVRTLVRSFLSRLQKQQKRLICTIGEKLVEECGAIVMKSVKTAGSTMFRPTGERPTLPNDYVKRLLDPLQFFLDSGSVTANVEEEMKWEIKEQVAKGVCVVYRQALVDNLSFREKSWMSLRRLNKGRLAVASSTDQASEPGKGDDLANVYHQHWLDVCAFGQVLKEFGTSEVQEHRDLSDLIISKKEAHENPSP